MKVLDFINENCDRMNETDFFQTLNRLADQYADFLAMQGIRSGEGIRDHAILSGFLLQEIVKNAEGKHMLAKAPSVNVLRYLNTVVVRSNLD